MKGRLRALRGRLRGDPPVIHRADGRPDAVALTFDDGPSEWTLRVAAALEAHDGRGTFFLRGAAVEADAATAASLASAGHELGNHLWSHADPARQRRGELRAEIERTAAVISEAAGTAPALVRPPYCGAPHAVARACRGTGAVAVVLRSVDPADWSLESPDDIFDRVMGRIGPGDIVCMHDGMPEGSRGTSTREPTVLAVERMVPALLQRGLRPVTVSQLLA